MASDFQSSLPWHSLKHSPIIQGGSGPLDCLNTQYVLDDGALIQISSRYKPSKVSLTPCSSSRRSQNRAPSSSQKSAASLGEWQLLVARTVCEKTSWFEGRWSGQDLVDLISQGGFDCLAALEESTLAAFQKNDLSLGVSAKDRLQDGSWQSVVLIMGGSGGYETANSLRVKLKSTDVHEALVIATYMSMELSRDNLALRKLVQTKQAKLEHSRKLAGITQPVPPRLGASLTNPGRVKRQRQDDEGFEDDGSDEKQEADEVSHNQEQGIVRPEESGQELQVGDWREEEEEEEEMVSSPNLNRSEPCPPLTKEATPFVSSQRSLAKKRSDGF